MVMPLYIERKTNLQRTWRPFTKNVDSTSRSRGSNSTADFKFELTQSLQLPNPCRWYIDDIIVPRPWFNIDEHNNHIYINAVDADNNE